MAPTWRGLAYASGSLAARYIVGDCITQRVLEQPQEKHDWRRTCLFGSFGATMGAPAYLFYAEFPSRVLVKLVEGRWMVAAMIGVDALIFMPLVYLPCFYTFREAIYNRHGSCGSLAAASFVYWSEHVLVDMRAAAPLLITSDIVMFTALPAIWRVPFLSSIGLIWVFYISLKRGARESNS